MNIIINESSYNISNIKHSFLGKEAKVYILEDQCLKYFTEETLLQISKQKKVLLLCDKYDELINKEGFQYVGIPKNPAYIKDKFIGYTMTFFKSCKTITEYKYHLLKNKYRIDDFNNHKAIDIVKQLFNHLKLLHDHKIILGDINPENIIINTQTNKSFIIDIDSAHVGNYGSFTGKDEYMCPIVVSIGVNSDKSWSYSTASDIYSLAVICLELIIGTHPYEVPVTPIIEISEAKKENVSYLNYYHTKKTNCKGYILKDKFVYEKVFSRLDYLKKEYSDLYYFFVDTFIHGKRVYLVDKKRVITTPLYTTKRRKRIKKIRPIRGYTPLHKKNDPIELGMFLNQFNINLKHIKQ